MNTEIKRSRTPHHGRIVTLALAASAAGLMFVPPLQGVASASSVALQANAGYVSTEMLAVGCPSFVSSACGPFWWDEQKETDHDDHDESDKVHKGDKDDQPIKWGHDESHHHDDKADHHHDKWGHDKYDRHYDKWGQDKWGRHHDKWGQDKWGHDKLVFGKFVYGNVDRFHSDKADKSDKWGHKEFDRRQDKWGHNEFDHHYAGD